MNGKLMAGRGGEEEMGPEGGSEKSEVDSETGIQVQGFCLLVFKDLEHSGGGGKMREEKKGSPCKVH